MAFLAYVTVSPNYVLPGQSVDVLCVMTNTGTSNLTVNSISPNVSLGLSSSARQVVFPVGSSNVVPAGGTLAVPWSDSYGVSQQSLTPEAQFNVGALILTSDGVYTAATPATVSVALPSQVPPIQPGTQPYTPSPGPLAAVTAALPLAGATPYPPTFGQARFDWQLNSSLVAALGL